MLLLISSQPNRINDLSTQPSNKSIATGQDDSCRCTCDDMDDLTELVSH